MNTTTKDKKRGILVFVLAALAVFYFIHGLLMKGGGFLPALGSLIAFGGIVAAVYGAFQVFRKQKLGWLAITGGVVGLLAGGALLPSDSTGSSAVMQASSTSSSSPDISSGKPDHWACVTKAENADQMTPGTCSLDAQLGHYNDNPYCFAAHDRAEKYCHDHNDVAPY